MNPAPLKSLDWRNATDQEISRVVARSRGEELRRSARGFGYSRRKNEVLPGQSSYRDGWYYDTFSVGAGAAFPTVSTFAVPQGQAGKTLAQTNLTGQGGQVPSGETLIARSIRIYISNSTVPADFQNILSNVSVEFKVRNNPIYQCTPGWMPAGYGGVMFASAQLGTAPAGTATVTSLNNGAPVQTAAFEFKYPYTMESQLNFTVLFTPQTAFNMAAASGVNPLGVGTTIVVWLEGDKQQVIAG